MNSSKDFRRAIKDRNYWNKRAEQLYNSLDKKEYRLNNKLSNYYRKEAEKLNKEIARYYQKYGKDNVIEYRKLLLKLNTAEQTMLIEDVDRFVAIHPEYAHLKKVRESIYKLDRLQGLQISIEMQQLEMATKEEELVKEHLTRLYEDEYFKAMKGFGYGSSFNTVDKTVIDRFINAQWINGLNFSERIYANREKLAEWLHTHFRDGVIRGETYDDMAKELMTHFNEVSKHSAKRLIATESNYVLNEAHITVFEKEFEEYKYHAVMDHRTTPVCRSLNGQQFKMQDRQAGVNFPPMHPFCRSTFAIVIPDDWLERSFEKHIKNK